MADNCVEILESEKGTNLCRVRGEGGIFLGFRKDILTENLTDRDIAFLVCTRCQGILREVCISSSGEQFCSCCTKEEEQTHPNIHVRNTVLSLKCSCPLYQRGCEWLGTLGECENHLDVCGHVHEKCKLGCEIVLPRHEHKIHVSEKCNFREIPCEHCKINFKVCDMSNHLSKCDKMPLTCELKCGTVVCREDMARHLDKDCGRVLEKCKLGCEIVLPREELNNHVNEKCVQRMIPCEHCKRDFKVCDMSNHLEECPKMPLTCELECGMLVCREDMVRHLEEECVEKKVECPFIKYKCEVGLVKRKEINQHLEEKRTEHIELKLSAMEEIIINQSQTIAKQNEINSKHSESNSKQGNLIQRMSMQKELNHGKLEVIVMKQGESIERMSQEIESLKTEVKLNKAEYLKQISPKITKLHWRINDIQRIMRPSFSSLSHGVPQEHFQAHGYNFTLKLDYVIGDTLEILFHPQDTIPSEPFKAVFVTSLICHSNQKRTKELGNKLINLYKLNIPGYTIARFDRSVITAEFIKDKGIELEIIVNKLTEVI